MSSLRRRSRKVVVALASVGLLAGLCLGLTSNTPALAKADTGTTSLNGVSYSLDYYDHGFTPYYYNVLPYVRGASLPWATGVRGLGIVGSPTLGTSGQHGNKSIHFTASSQYLQVGKTTSTTTWTPDLGGATTMGTYGNQDAAISVLFQADNLTNVQTLAERIGNTGGYWRMTLGTDGKVTCAAKQDTGSTNAYTVTSTTAVTSGTWNTAVCGHVHGDGSNVGAWTVAWVTPNQTQPFTGLATVATAGDTSTVAYGLSATSSAVFANNTAHNSPLTGYIDGITWSDPQTAARAASFDTVFGAGQGVLSHVAMWDSCSSAALACQTNQVAFQDAFDSTLVDGGSGQDFSCESTNGTVFAPTCGAHGSLQTWIDTGSDAGTDGYWAAGDETASGVAGNSHAINFRSPCDWVTIPCTATGASPYDATMMSIQKYDNTGGAGKRIAWDPTNPGNSTPWFGALGTDKDVVGIVFKSNATPGADVLTDGPNLFQQGYSDASKSDGQLKIQIGKCQTRDGSGNCTAGLNDHDRAAECVMHQDLSADGTNVASSDLRASVNGYNVMDGNWHSIICIKYADGTDPLTGKTATKVGIIVDGRAEVDTWTTNDGSAPNGTGTNEVALGDLLSATNVNGYSGSTRGTLGTNYGANGLDWRPTFCGRENFAVTTPFDYNGHTVTGTDNCDATIDGFATSRASTSASGTDPVSTLQYWLAQVTLP